MHHWAQRLNGLITHGGLVSAGRNPAINNTLSRERHSRRQNVYETAGQYAYVEWNDWCFRPRFCIVRLYSAWENLGVWVEFCYESCPWCRIDRSTCWPAVRCTSTVPRTHTVHRCRLIWGKLKASKENCLNLVLDCVQTKVLYYTLQGLLSHFKVYQLGSHFLS